ncbi:MAG: hypothetical protein HZB84_10370 [Deltaproteobacteria bacterium]|nr:hypothetical protein [Deltaproteobacteria bacterium]
MTITLAKNASTYHLIPIYVESQHWSKLQLDGVDELWDIISNSLSQFSTSLHVTEELFRHMLQHGLLCFIFDGFDELCGHRRFPLSAADVLNQLARIAQDSDARMILTTRTLYWESEIANKPSNVRMEQLAPFNTQQAKGYFAKHFPGDIVQRDRAFSLYQNLQKRVQPPTVEGGLSSRNLFINLPVCVNMVAECVKLGAVTDSAYQFKQGIVRGFLDLICEREQVRQGLLATAGEQLLAFEELAIEHVENQAPEFDIGLLELIGIAPKMSAKLLLILCCGEFFSQDINLPTTSYHIFLRHAICHNIFKTNPEQCKRSQ